MKKEQKAIIVAGILVFLIIALILFLNLNNKNTSEDVTVSTKEEIKDGNKEKEKDKVTSTGSISETNDSNNYNYSTRSVKKVRRVLVNNCETEETSNNQEEQKQINQNELDVQKLVLELEAKVNNAKNKEELDLARNFAETKQVESKVESLPDSSLKKNLKLKMKKLNLILKDKTAPTVNVEEGKTYKKEITLDVKDENEVKIMLDGKQVANKSRVKDGKHKLVITDVAFNVTTVNFTVDTKGPQIAFEGGSKNIKIPSNENITIKLTDLSGVAKVSYFITEKKDNKGYYGKEVSPKSIKKNPDGTYSVTVDVTGKNGEYYIFVKATDTLGHVSTTRSDRYYIDTKGPEITFEGGSKDSKKPSNKNITIKLSDRSGLKNVSYFITEHHDNKGYYGKEVSAKSIKRNADGTYSVTIDVTGKNGGYYIFVKATDKLGNVSKIRSDRYYIDTKGPEITFKGGSTNYLKPSNENITIKLSDVNGLKALSYFITEHHDNKGYYGKEVSPKSIKRNADGTYSVTIDVTGKNGGYYIFVKAIDKLGNVSKIRSDRYYIDTKGPEITFEGGSKSYKRPSNENITIKLCDISKIKTVSYLITQSCDNKGNYGEEVAPEAIVKNPDGTYSVTIDVTGKDGGYYIFVKATDKLGNVSTAKSDHYYIDAKGPEIAFEGGSKSYKNPSKENITIKLSDRSKVNSVSYLITQSYDNKGNYGEEVALEAIVKNPDGTYSVTVDVTGKSGGYYIFVKAKDKLGNVSTTKSDHYYIDAKGPEITFEGGSKSYKKPSNENITIKLSDRSKLDSVSYLITQSYDNKGNYGEEVAPEAIIENPDGTYSITVDVTGKNGGYYIFVKATDVLGNMSTAKEGHFYIDTTAPEITFEGGSKSYKKPSNENITMNIVEKNLSTVSYLITQSYDNKGNYGEEVAPEAIVKNPDGTYSVTVDVTGKEGGYYIFAKAIDVAGNETTIKSDHYYIDAKGPEITFEGGSRSYKKPSNEDITINIDEKNLSTVSYLITQSYDNKGNYGEEVAPEAIIENPDGTHSVIVDVTDKNGGYYIFVKATDTVGNVSTIKEGHFYIDTTAPEITFSGGSKSSKKYSDEKITMNISEKNDIASVSYLIKQGSTNKGYGTPIDSSEIIENPDGTYSVDIDIANKNGGYYIFAKVVDVAGNETTTRAGNYYINTIQD